MGIFLPVFGCFAGSYSLQHGGEVEYDGLVPCGKCLKVKDVVTIPAPTVWSGKPDNSDITQLWRTKLDGFVQMTNNYCVGSKIKSEPQTIPAGQGVYINCQLCHFFILIQGVINFLLINIIPYLAVLMIVIGGAMFYFGGARPELVQRGKKLIFGVIFGLFLIYGAYIIVSFFLSIINLAEVNPVSNIFKDGIFSIKCPVKIF